jgi:hypothetical protein
VAVSHRPRPDESTFSDLGGCERSGRISDEFRRLHLSLCTEICAISTRAEQRAHLLLDVGPHLRQAGGETDASCRLPRPLQLVGRSASDPRGGGPVRKVGTRRHRHHRPCRQLRFAPREGRSRLRPQRHERELRRRPRGDRARSPVGVGPARNARPPGVRADAERRHRRPVGPRPRDRPRPLRISRRADGKRPLPRAGRGCRGRPDDRPDSPRHAPPESPPPARPRGKSSSFPTRTSASPRTTSPGRSRCSKIRRSAAPRPSSSAKGRGRSARPSSRSNSSPPSRPARLSATRSACHVSSDSRWRSAVGPSTP